MAVADSSGFPIACSIENATPHEVKLVEATLDSAFTSDLPEKLIGDKAYDSDTLDRKLFEERGVELISPNKVNRKNAKQDGRKLRRYKKRWKVERLFAWLQNFRRITTRFERYSQNFEGFVHLGAIMIIIKHL